MNFNCGWSHLLYGKCVIISLSCLKATIPFCFVYLCTFCVFLYGPMCSNKLVNWRELICAHMYISLWRFMVVMASQETAAWLWYWWTKTCPTVLGLSLSLTDLIGQTNAGFNTFICYNININQLNITVHIYILQWCIQIYIYIYT